ncbi:MAG: hypothetical protein JJD92_16105 [Frankiaceae bacterium]|nr:hypothetical protein [Frankiaceae bacterium]
MFLAHAFGERYDLPIPLVLFVVGGGLVVLLSFALVLRRTPASGDELGYDGDSPATPTRGWGALALVVLAALTYAGLAGSQDLEDNIVPTAFWLLVWIAVPLTCGLVGDWTRPVNPFAFLARIADISSVRRVVLARESPLVWPARLGWWPAAMLYAVLACSELVFNATATQPRVVATGFVVYALANVAAGLVFGASWLQRGEVFTVLFSTWGRLGWFRFGAAGPRGFAGGLRVPFDPSAGRVAFVLLLLISVNFDGLLATPAWDELERGQVSGDALDLFRLASFLLLALLIAVVFGGFATASARSGRHDVGPTAALAGLLPSMVPIAFGYLLAHNLQYLLVNAQLLGPLIGNPTGRDPLHLPYPFNDALDPNPTFLPSAFYWYAGLVAIVAAHVLAVVLAHRHLAARAVDDELAQRSEYPWLIAMVAYTMVSLTLIAQPLVAETSAADAVGVLPSGPAGPVAAAALQHGHHITVDAGR